MILPFPISPKHQQGSALTIAIFVIVVMALLAVGLLQMIDDGSRNASWEVLGTRADLAANSALERSLAELFPLNVGTDDCAAVTTDISYAGAGLEGCSAIVECSPLGEGDGEVAELGQRVFDLLATGICGSGEVQVERKIAIQARG
ncbi:pilus assembly PilX family protein [Aliagarivorans taiwanensis]|uniref:pilus assembly PilX family protein n=1 Tax=Aliagarivorans taiwanensis TaxID=561966 RepID=UPI0004154D81|nr:hypothetical protein [Aliagarivorans taiwanensis]